MRKHQDGMYKGEIAFKKILEQSGLKFEFHKAIRLYGVCVRTPDFYIPSYDLYIEVVSNRQSLHYGNVVDKLKRVMKAGYNITFYSHIGYKIEFTSLMLDRLGKESNDEFFSIPEIDKWFVNRKH